MSNKGGRPPLPRELKIARGERRKSRLGPPSNVVRLHATTFDPAGAPINLDMPKPPAGMTRRARSIWIAKCHAYARRGQAVAGFESVLRMYCELESRLHDAWRDGEPPNAALLTTHRKLAAEFFDTPATWRGSMPSAPTAPTSPTNRFRNNGPRGPYGPRTPAA
jgi:hypothetical protein